MTMDELIHWITCMRAVALERMHEAMRDYNAERMEHYAGRATAFRDILDRLGVDK